MNFLKRIIGSLFFVCSMVSVVGAMQPADYKERKELVKDIKRRFQNDGYDDPGYKDLMLEFIPIFKAVVMKVPSLDEFKVFHDKLMKNIRGGTEVKLPCDKINKFIISEEYCNLTNDQFLALLRKSLPYDEFKSAVRSSNVEIFENYITGLTEICNRYDLMDQVIQLGLYNTKYNDFFIIQNHIEPYVKYLYDKQCSDLVLYRRRKVAPSVETADNA